MPVNSDLARALLAIREHYIRMEELTKEYMMPICREHEQQSRIGDYMNKAGMIDDQLYNTVSDLISLGDL